MRIADWHGRAPAQARSRGRLRTTCFWGRSGLATRAAARWSVRASVLATLLTATGSGGVLALQTGPACVGDCDDDGMVRINELITGVNIALGVAPVSACPAFDCPQPFDGVLINCAVEAVDNALFGCRTTTATPTAIATGTRTCGSAPPPPSCAPGDAIVCGPDQCARCHCATPTPFAATYTPPSTCTVSATPTVTRTPTVTPTPTATRTCPSAPPPATCPAGEEIACADQLCSINCGCGTVTSTPTPTNTCTPGANPPPGCRYEGAPPTPTSTPCNHEPTATTTPVATPVSDCSGVPDLRPCVDPCGNGVCQQGHCIGECTPSRTATVSPQTTPSRTPTSCVSEPPDIYEPTPRNDNPFIWHVAGRSRILLNGRGLVGACLNGHDRLTVERRDDQFFDVEAEFEPTSTNLLEFCTFPSRCGTPYCARRTVVCDGFSCVASDLPPTQRTSPFCEGATPEVSPSPTPTPTRSPSRHFS